MNWQQTKNFDENVELTEKQVRMVFYRWFLQYKYTEADEFLVDFLSVKSEFESESKIKLARLALFKSIANAARASQVSEAAWRQFEKGEALGSISLETLKKCAEALECELVYCLRPKTKELYSEIVWQKLFAEAKEDRQWQKPSSVRDRVLRGLINRKSEDLRIRRKLGFSNEVMYMIRRQSEVWVSEKLRERIFCESVLGLNSLVNISDSH